MKKNVVKIGIVITYFFGASLFISCTNGEPQKNEQTNHMSDDGHNHSDGHSHDHGSNEENVSIETSEYSGEKVKDLSLIIDGYLALKNELSDDNSEGAAKSGSGLLVSFSGFDKEALTETQRDEYLEIEESAIENTEHIIKNASEIDHQREHLLSLSEDINDLITLLGTDRKLYVDFCPMANNKKGAIWISESQAIRNPYMGSKMPTCGKIQNEIN